MQARNISASDDLGFQIPFLIFVATEMYGCVDFVVLLATVVKTDINRIVVPCYVTNDIIHSAITNLLNGSTR